MDKAERKKLEYGRAICYSGFREGQNPDTGIFPSYEEVKEDLLLLHGHWTYLRLYDCDQLTEMVLDIIRTEEMSFKVMLGAYIAAEVSNPACAWGGVFNEKDLRRNKMLNQRRIKKLIDLANEYQDVVVALSVGNEATVSWTDHMVPVKSVIEYVQQVKASTIQPVTFCENYVPWLNKLKPLADEVDLISIHTYPVWEYKSIREAMNYTKQNYHAVADRYPSKEVIITEAGWTTHSNGIGIDVDNVNEKFQSQYLHDLLEWCDREEIITFVFEAFDEPWKGSDDPMEPEKHWGLYKEDRTPKLALRNQGML